MMVRVCDYCGLPVVYEVTLQDIPEKVIDTCHQDVGGAIRIGVDNMQNTRFSVRFVGKDGS